jgi:hypothetical protein
MAGAGETEDRLGRGGGGAEALPHYGEIFLRPQDDMFLVGNRFVLGFGTDRSRLTAKASRGRRLRVITLNGDCVTRQKDETVIHAPYAASQDGIDDRYVPITDGRNQYYIGIHTRITLLSKTPDGLTLAIESQIPVALQPVAWNTSPRTALAASQAKKHPASGGK